MNIENEFRSDVRTHLERLTDDLVPVLAQLANHEFPGQVATIAFEVFYYGFTSGFPVRAFFLDDHNAEFFIFEGGEAKYPSPVDPALLEIEQVYPDELEDRYSAQDETLDTYTLASMELIDWFSGCWNNAGGKDFPRAATIAIHDDDKAFDLKAGAWLDGMYPA